MEDFVPSVTSLSIIQFSKGLRRLLARPPASSIDTRIPMSIEYVIEVSDTFCRSKFHCVKFLRRTTEEKLEMISSARVSTSIRFPNYLAKQFGSGT